MEVELFGWIIENRQRDRADRRGAPSLDLFLDGRQDIGEFRSSIESVFLAPPAEWIEERVAGLKEVLERRTEVSALLLRKLLGEIRLEPKAGTETGRPYYLARTSLQALEILEPPPGGPEGGSNSLRWWRRGESNLSALSLPPCMEVVSL